MINTFGDVSALLFKTNQIRKIPEVTAGIYNKTNNIPTIEAQFKEAANIKKRVVIPSNLDQLSKVKKIFDYLSIR